MLFLTKMPRANGPNKSEPNLIVPGSQAISSHVLCRLVHHAGGADLDRILDVAWTFMRLPGLRPSWHRWSPSSINHSTPLHGFRRLRHQVFAGDSAGVLALPTKRIRVGQGFHVSSCLRLSKRIQGLASHKHEVSALMARVAGSDITPSHLCLVAHTYAGV